MEQSSTYVTVSNSLPVFSSAYVLPSVGVRSGTELSCYSEVTDPDFTDVTQTYRWSRNGELISLGQTLLLTDENASQGDTGLEERQFPFAGLRDKIEASKE